MSVENTLDSSLSNDIKVKTPKAKIPKLKEIKIESKPVLKKLEPETMRKLSALREKANKKEYGRKVRDSEILSLALSLVEQAHLEALQEATYSENDRLKIAHAEYQKMHGKLTLDQFIGKLLSGEIHRESKV